MAKTSKLGIPFKSGTKEYQRAWKALNPNYEKDAYSKYKDRKRDLRRERSYGISAEQFEQLLKDQEYRCKICRTKKVRIGQDYFHVDHNHETGKVRGLLCDKCNRGLGYFDDRSDLLEKAAAYIDENNED